MSVIYGYARVSTKGQERDGNSLEDQETKLRAEGCQEIFHDSFTGTKMERPEFTKLLEKLQPGDRLVVTKLDRFARTASKGIDTIYELLDRGIAVHILNMGLIDNTPTGKLIATVLLAFAEFERNMIIERTLTGKAVAKANDPEWREGRKKIAYDPAEVKRMRRMQKRGKVTGKECAVKFGISEAQWYKWVKEIA